MELFLKSLIGILIAASIILYYISIKGIKEIVPKDNRDYMDPLPYILLKFWPIVKVLTYFIGERMPVDLLEKYNKQLKQSGFIFLMTPEQYVGVRVFSAIGFALLMVLLMALLNNFSVWYLLVGLVIGFYLPTIKMNDRRKQREKEIIRALPVYLDYLTMTIQAGMNLSGAIQQAVDKGPEGPLKVEFSKVIRDIRAGMPRAEAIRSMAERLDIREINAFATSVIQAEKTGASVGATLLIQADQRRVERFQRAEKLAMEAPVKLIFPLVAFIFPMTFIILGFPIVMKFMYDL